MREYLTKRHRRLPPAARRATCHLPAPRKPFDPRSEPQLHKTMDHFSGSPRHCLRLEDMNISFAHPLPTSLARGMNALSQGHKPSQTAEQGYESIWGHTRAMGAMGAMGAMEPCNVGVISGHVRPGCREACRLTTQTQAAVAADGQASMSTM